MPVSVAMIPYVNMAPYRMLGPPEGCRFIPLVPRASISALLAGEVNAAAVPVGGLAALEGVVETVGNFGIAAKGECMSVLLFSRVPFDKFTTSRTLRITTETASSVRLLYLLLGATNGFDRLPQPAEEGRTPDGELLIGDRALVKGQASIDDSSCYITDLSESWFELYGVPFVFARWVVRKDAPGTVKAAISQWLNEFERLEPELVEKAVPESCKALNLSQDIVRRYFQAIRRSLNEQDLQGQIRFFDLLEKFGRRPLFIKTGTDYIP